MIDERRSRILAKRRAARRSASAGAVMFIVAMTVTVLAAVGLYALSATSAEIKTTGYERQSSQTHYLSEYGVLGASQQISGTQAQLYIGLMVSRPDTGCVSLRGIPASGVTSWGQVPGPLARSCRRMGSGELAGAAANGGWQNPVLEPYQPSQPTKPGSLGSVPISGDFFIEMTDPNQASPPAGFDLKLGLCFTQVTISSTGITQPVLPTGNEAAVFGSEGLETARARITGGPIRCPQ